MKSEKSFKKHCVNLMVKKGLSKREFNLSQELIKHWVNAPEQLASYRIKPKLA